MLPRNDLSSAAVGRVDPVTQVSRTERIGEAAQQAFQRAMSEMLGQPLKATVAARLGDGSFLVNLNDTVARMQLPAGAKVGAELDLKLLALTPRPTFELAGQGKTATIIASAPPPSAAAPSPTPAALPSAATGLPLPTGTGLQPAAPGATGMSQAHAAALLGKAPMIPTALLADTLAGAAPATLSQTAQILGAVLRSAMSQANAPGRIVAGSPITPGPGVGTAQLAEALDQAVSLSGLFYESHVAQWSRGQRSIGQLAQEPLMQQQQQLLRAGAEIESVRRQMAPAEPAIAQVIDLQLQVQEQQRVAWQGQVWPGQDMRWEIQRRTEGDSSAPDGQADEEAASWHSTLTLRFAALGDIGARLVLSGDQVLLRLDAASDDVAALLRAHSGELESALHASGSFASVSIGTATADGGEAHDG